MVKGISENLGDIIKGIKQFNLIKSLVKVFRVWLNKEALNMECNKRNRYIRYATFRDSNLNQFQMFC